jgi:hypothetical protein
MSILEPTAPSWDVPKATWILGMIVVWFLSGCAAFQREPLMQVDEETSRQVLNALRHKESAISSLRGLFQASVSGHGIPLSQDFTGIVAYREPDHVHLRGFIRLGMPVLDFVREGEDYRLSFPAEGKVVSGRLEGSEQMSEWDRTVLLSLRALDAILGKIGTLSDPDVHILKRKHLYRIDIPRSSRYPNSLAPDELVRAWIDQATLDLKSVEYIRSSEDVMVTVKCEDYREVKDTRTSVPAPLRLPFRVKAVDHRMLGGTLTLTFQEYVVNAA